MAQTNVATGMFVGVIGVIVVVAVVAMSGGGGGGGGAPAPPRPEHTEFNARIMCNQFIRDRLRAPSTAKFPSSTERAVHQGDGRYIVTGAVDAQNAFGAQIRNTYTCEVQHVSGSSWRLVELRM